MKKALLIIFLLICIVAIILVVANKLMPLLQNIFSETPTEPSEPGLSDDISDYLTTKNGMPYLILPISKAEAYLVSPADTLATNIDLTLLKTVEQKILDQLAEYGKTPNFIVGHTASTGHLYLYAEIIVMFDPADETDTHNPNTCGLDHEHITFKEQITKE